MSERLAWPFRGPRAGLAFSARYLVAVAEGRGEGPRVAELPAGLIDPSPSSPNVSSVAELARLVSEAVAATGLSRPRVVLALPDLSVTTALIDAPGRHGDSEATRQLSDKLGYPLSDARTDVWKGPLGEVLGAAVRGAVVHQFEEAVEAAECRIGWVDSASTARLPGWISALEEDGGLRAAVQLYQSHYVIAVFRGRKLADLRMKLRSAGDAERVGEELARLPGVHGESGFVALILSGEDASAVARVLETRHPAVVEAVVENDGEARQLAASALALLARSREPR